MKRARAENEEQQPASARSIYAIASESSLDAALEQAPQPLRAAIACRTGLWGGFVHMTLCSFDEHVGVDVIEAAEAMLASGRSRLEDTHAAGDRCLRLPVDRWEWDDPVDGRSAYAGRHILVCHLRGGSNVLSAVMKTCGEHRLVGTRVKSREPSSKALHVTIPLEARRLPCDGAAIRAFLARLEWELAVVRLDGPKAAATPPASSGAFDN